MDNRDSTPVDSGAIRQELLEAGFYKLEKQFTHRELDACEKVLTQLLTGNNFSSAFLKKEMSSQIDSKKQQQVEILRPSLLSKQLRNSAVFKRCQTIAAHYFDADAYYLFDHAIFKMPGSSSITPWHQDQAYLDSELIIPSLHFWIPFQDTTANNGALRFAKGYQFALIPHKPAYPDNPRILEAIESPSQNIHTMDICRGDVSLHTHLTLHSATQNHSNEIRKAWVIHFGKSPSWHKHWSKLKRIATKNFTFFNASK